MTFVCPSCAAPLEAGADVCTACGRAVGKLALGSVLASRYELRAVLGKGGMGLVYRAYDRLLEEEVAIKVLRTDLGTSADAIRRFRGEIKLARKVSHPNVCRIHDYGEEGPLGYISMEILTGQDLHKALKEQPHGLPETEAVSAILQISSGLQAIHEVGILHRDLKTANVSRDERGVVRLVDFGIAKDLHSQEHTAAGESFGTPEYMSPEHCRGEALDYRSDVYALGILAFELLTGDVPIRGATPMATIFKQVQENVSFDDERGARVPRRFVSILAKALAKAPSARFSSAQEFAQALRTAALSEPAAAPPADSASAEPPPAPKVFKDVRKDERIQLPTDVVVRKLGGDGTPLREERTVAHDLSRSGMRILTSWSDLERGDQVSVSEVGGDFITGAIVRNVIRGTDHITRVGVEFLGNRAPDRLVGTGSIQRPTQTLFKPSSAPPSSKPTPQPFAPPAQPPGSGPRPAARVNTPPRGSVAPPFTPSASGVRSAQLPNSGSREATRVNPPPRVSVTPPITPSASVPSAGSAEASVQSSIEKAMADARRLMKESKTDEALQTLTRARELSAGPKQATEIRILMAEVQAKIPDLQEAARQNLEELALAEPDDVRVQVVLAEILKQSGLSARSRVAYGRALALDPGNAVAKAGLAELDAAGRTRW